MEITDPLRVSDRDGWREWLSRNHDREKGCWLIYDRNEGNISYLDAVEEALCFGWIDSTMKRIDDVTGAQRFTPRRKGSMWTELNKERVRRLIRIGKMTPAGLAVLPDLDIPYVIHERIMERIAEDERAYENLMGFPELYVRIRTGNIARYEEYPEVFENKIGRFVDMTRENRMYGEWHDKGRLLETDR